MRPGASWDSKADNSRICIALLTRKSEKVAHGRILQLELQLKQVRSEKKNLASQRQELQACLNAAQVRRDDMYEKLRIEVIQLKDENRKKQDECCHLACVEKHLEVSA